MAYPIKEDAQQEFKALNEIMNYSKDFSSKVESTIEEQSEFFDGSQSVTEFVDMCIMLAQI